MDELPDLVRGLLEDDADNQGALLLAQGMLERAPQAEPVRRVDWFGQRQLVVGLGNREPEHICNRMAARYMQSVDRMDGLPVRKSMLAVVKSFVTSKALKSMAVAAEAANTSKQSVARTLKHFAYALLWATYWVMGAALLCWRGLFRQHYRAVCVINKFKYDETPLRMRVSEFNEVFQQMPSRTIISKKSGEGQRPEEYAHAKILRVDWCLSPSLNPC